MSETVKNTSEEGIDMMGFSHGQFSDLARKRKGGWASCSDNELNCRVA
jgi:hypothetical protein